MSERNDIISRHYPRYPLVGVGAVILCGTDVLLVRRGNPPAYGKWSLPGGLVEVGESLHDAVCREVLEETGLRVEVVSLVKVLDRIVREDGTRILYHYVLVDFLCRVCAGVLKPGSDALDCRFFPVDGLNDLAITRGTVQVVHDAYHDPLAGARSLYLTES